jgi:hypothetical protein
VLDLSFTGAYETFKASGIAIPDSYMSSNEIVISSNYEQ